MHRCHDQLSKKGKKNTAADIIAKETRKKGHETKEEEEEKE